MKWSIPAKTFILGEYAAIAQRSAILVTTTPYFEVKLVVVVVCLCFIYVSIGLITFSKVKPSRLSPYFKFF